MSFQAHFYSKGMYSTLQRKLYKHLRTYHECATNVHNALFHELDNFRALSLGSRTHTCLFAPE